MKERGLHHQRNSQHSFHINYEELMSLCRDQSSLTAILTYRLQHGPRSMICPTVGDALSTCRRSKRSQTIQDSLSAEHLVQCSAHQYTLDLYWEADSGDPPEAGPSCMLAFLCFGELFCSVGSTKGCICFSKSPSRLLS